MLILHRVECNFQYCDALSVFTIEECRSRLHQNPINLLQSRFPQTDSESGIHVALGNRESNVAAGYKVKNKSRFEDVPSFMGLFNLLTYFVLKYYVSNTIT